MVGFLAFFEWLFSGLQNGKESIVGDEAIPFFVFGGAQVCDWHDLFIEEIFCQFFVSKGRQRG